MNIRKWTALLICITMTVCTSSALSKAHDVYAEDTGYSCRIMCVGDSITHGYINGDNGYRKYLCYYLGQNGISYDMVGPENNWTDSTEYNWNGTPITYDPAHCGYSGYAIRQYNGRSGIYETMFGNGNVMQTYDPDIVLLQIGTNDLLDARLDIVNNTGDITAELSALERLESLVDEIIVNMDTADALFLASVPYIDAEVRSDWLNAYGYIIGVDTSNTAELQSKVNECVDRYNEGVKALADKKHSEGKNVHFADINSVVDMKSGLEDGVHPNESGYAEMGKLWADTLSSYLGGGAFSDTTTTVTETTTTITETTTASETTATTTVAGPERLLGDANENGSIELADAVLLRKYLLGVTGKNDIAIENCDIDSNARVNILDAVMLLEILTGNRT